MGINKIRELILNNSTISMTFEQYKAYSSGELTLCEVKDIKRATKEINKLLEHPLIFKRATLITALLLSLEKKCYALQTSPAFDQQMERLQNVIDRVMQIVYVIQTVGFVVCLVMGLIDIIKAIINKDTGQVISIGIKYLLGFSSLFLFPYLLRMILDILGYNGGILW